MKISELYNLKKTQYELDFVDIDPDKDIPLFLDPYYISKCDFPFAADAQDTIRSYFEYLLALLRGKQIQQAEEVFSHLGESNDICMGMSKGKPRGHGMGPEDTIAIFKELLKSKAISSGVMEDIEDFRIFVPNVDKDKVSDMTANIIKKHLIEYTKPAGTKNASKYHNLIIGILELLLYPNLSSPKKEAPIHEGRKRIDITFHNSAETGFFYTLPSKNSLLPCQFIFVECKNYTGEVANPELDQLSGRFSPRKGKVGILACRNLDENDTFLKRCADTYEDERGLIIPLTDEDLIKALRQFPQKGVAAIEEILSNKYEQICFMK